MCSISMHDKDSFFLPPALQIVYTQDLVLMNLTCTAFTIPMVHQLQYVTPVCKVGKKGKRFMGHLHIYFKRCLSLVTPLSFMLDSIEIKALVTLSSTQREFTKIW